MVNHLKPMVPIEITKIIMRRLVSLHCKTLPSWSKTWTQMPVPPSCPWENDFLHCTAGLWFSHAFVSSMTLQRHHYSATISATPFQRHLFSVASFQRQTFKRRIFEMLKCYALKCSALKCSALKCTTLIRRRAEMVALNWWHWNDGGEMTCHRLYTLYTSLLI